MEAAARPLPREDTTPPVTKMYFADISASNYLFFLIGHATGARLSIAGFGRRGNGDVRDEFVGNGDRRFEVQGSRFEAGASVIRPAVDFYYTGSRMGVY